MGTIDLEKNSREIMSQKMKGNIPHFDKKQIAFFL